MARLFTELAGDDLHLRLLLGLGEDAVPHAEGPIGKVPHRAADADGIVVAQKASHLPDDHGDGVGRKLDVQVGIEIVDCLDEPDTTHLEQVFGIFAPPGETADDAEHEAQVADDETIPRLCIARVCPQ